MADLSIPLVNRGAEALEALLNYDEERARANVRLLTFSELLYLAAAARELSALATAVREETWPAPGPRLAEMLRDAEQPEGGEDAERTFAFWAENYGFTDPVLYRREGLDALGPWVEADEDSTR